MASKKDILLFPFVKGRLRDCSGFSLVEILAALGITTILAMAMASTMGFLGVHKKSVELSQEADELVSDFRLAFQNTATCTNMLTTTPININTSAAVPLSLSVTNRGASRTFAAGTTLVPGLTVASLDLLIDNVMGAKDTLVDTGGGVMKNMSQYQAFVRIQFQKTDTFNQKPVQIPLKIYTEQGTTPIIACAGQQMKSANNCVDIGYKWDATTSTCLPTGRCLYGGSFSTSPVGGFVNPLTSANTCPAGYTEQQSGVINYSSDCGKSCVQANIVPVMSCLKCVDATGADMTFSASTPSTVTSGVDFSADLDSESSAIEEQFNQIQANLTRDASQPGFVCKPAGTFMLGTVADCTGGTVSTQTQPTPYYCCSGSVELCSVSMNLGIIGSGTVDILRYMQCQ